MEISEVITDILDHLGIILCAEAGHGKSYTAFTLVKEAIKRNDITVIVFSPSTIWRRKFGSINCVKVGTSDFNPIRTLEGVNVFNGNNGRDTIQINLDAKYKYVSNGFLEELLKSKEHLLFEIKYKNGRRIKHFIAESLKRIYNNQEKALENPNYKHHYIIVLEEMQNSLGTYSLNDDQSLEMITVFSQSRSDANIHYVGVTQRLSDVSTKAVERLRPFIGLTLGENSLRKIRNQLPKELRNVIQNLQVRQWLYLNGKDNPIITIPEYHRQGSVTYIRPIKPNPSQKSEKKSLFQRFKAWVNKPLVPTEIPTEQEETESQEEDEELENQLFEEFMEEEW